MTQFNFSVLFLHHIWKSILPKSCTWIALVSLHFLAVQAYPQSLQYPKNYFIFPINPGQPNQLTGNMGELRSNHFHGGLDIRTGGREGLPVYAAADGYVCRIKITRTGYGNALYIRHPNGYVTVYGHLKSYTKRIEQYLREQQYAQESFEVDLLPKPDELVVKKRDIVAYSGNTGGSGGPHLHFEIRDTLDTVLNPIYFGFNEVQDNLPPVITKLAVQAMEDYTRVNNEFGRFEFTPQKTSGKVYTISKPIPVWGTIGLELLTHDIANGVGSRNGVSCIEVKVDGQDLYSHHLETFTFDVTRHINVHTNYEVFQNNGNRFQRLYIADGNTIPIYQTDRRRGRLTINDTKPHRVSITVWDAHQNDSELQFTLQGIKPSPDTHVLIKPAAVTEPDIQQQLFENVLKLVVKNALNQEPAILHSRKNIYPLPPAYARGNELVYLWDLRHGVPDSAVLQGTMHRFAFRKVIPPKTDSFFEWDSLSILFPKKALYDTLYLTTERREDIISIGSPTIPLQEAIDIRFTPPTLLLDSRTAVYAVRGRRLSYIGGTWVNGAINFKIREFGDFALATDTVPPLVRIVSKTGNQIRLKVTDDLSGVGRYKAFLDGKWLLLEYDYKTDMLWSERLDATQPLKGTFILEVADNVGNKTTYETAL